MRRGTATEVSRRSRTCRARIFRLVGVRRLGYLERAVMTVLWGSHGDAPLSARQVASALADQRAYAHTTVLTVLDRLEGKALVTRNRAARTHTYAAATSREWRASPG